MRRALSDSPPEPHGPGPGLDPLSREDPVGAVMTAHATGTPLVLSTSGSSGRPRSIRRTTRSWFESFPAVARETGLDATSRMWVPGPLTGTMNLFAAVLCRAVGAVPGRSLEEATHAHLTPTVLRRALAEGLDLTGRHLTVAGDRLDRDLRDRARDRGALVAHYYGAAELSLVAWGSHQGDLGPFAGVDVRERDGVLWVRSPYLADVPTDEDGFATVGDRGTVAPDGRVLVRGRGETAVLTGGVTVVVEEVESALRSALTCEVVVVGVPHPELGEVVAAVVTDPVQVGTGHTRARSVLSETHRPRVWFVADVLPRTAGGKTDRAAVRAAAAAGALRRVSPVGAR